jgi:hypothetical protein
MYDENQSREFGGSLEDDSAQLWRYVALPILLRMLQTRTLFFPSIETLAKTDPWEGHWYPQEAPVVRSAMKHGMEKHLERGKGRPGVSGYRFPWKHPNVNRQVCLC